MKLPSLIALATLLSSCASYHSARNTHHAREYLTADIEEQIVFNLIRASNGLPFAHYDVDQVQSLVTDKANGTFGGEKTRETTGYQPGPMIGAMVRAITRKVTGGVGAERADGVTVVVKPVFKEPSVYEAYVKFLNIHHGGGYSKELPTASQQNDKDAGQTKLVSETKTTTTERDKTGEPVSEIVKTETVMHPAPAPGSPPDLRIRFSEIESVQSSSARPRSGYLPRTVRRWEGRWYYIPDGFKKEFSDLCMSLVARGGSGGGGTAAPAGRAQDEAVEALGDVKSELIRQNAIQQSR